jgi:uncharacterized protein (TIGR01777 family)
MHITLTGGTGFVGSRLMRFLRQEGHEPVVLSRHAEGPLGWDPASRPPDPAAFEGSGAVIHLAGEPVAQRWTPEVKRRIQDSRVLGTRNLIRTLAELPRKPEVLIAASAVGYYGSRGDEILNEQSAAGSGFLARTCVEWESASALAAGLGMRVVQLRIGVVLGPGGGALQTMLPPFRAGLGGPLAGGGMWMPWLHLDDLCRLILHCLDTQGLSGPVNAVAPQAVRNAEFTAALGMALRRPAFFPVPEFALRLLYGEMADVVLGSQRVVPAAAEASGFRFTFPSVDDALRSILA